MLSKQKFIQEIKDGRDEEEIGLLLCESIEDSIENLCDFVGESDEEENGVLVSEYFDYDEQTIINCAKILIHTIVHKVKIEARSSEEKIAVEKIHDTVRGFIGRFQEFMVKNTGIDIFDDNNDEE